MEIRPPRETDSRLEVSRIYEESWKSAYLGIVPQAYLDGIPTGRWAEALNRPGWDTLVLSEGERLVGLRGGGVSLCCRNTWAGGMGGPCRRRRVRCSLKPSTSAAPSTSTAMCFLWFPVPRRNWWLKCLRRSTPRRAKSIP